MSDQSKNEAEEEIKYKTIAKFLESTPPNKSVHISDLSIWKHDKHGDRNEMNVPEIQLHCDDEQCNGKRFFRCISDKKENLENEYAIYFYVTYRCSNCQKTTKIFALAASIDSDIEPAGTCYKFGEYPVYGPPISSKLIELIGPDKDEFLKGLRCENQGLGIGSFVYYRRVVENQKNRILEKIIDVSKKIGAPEDKINNLKNAVKEIQFRKALDTAKDSMPESLLINGHNPMLFLYRALSEGVHDLTDEQCLELAGNIRIVLGELSERLSQALKNKAELNKALSSLMNSKKDQKTR